jgi:hypothetical protein
MFRTAFSGVMFLLFLKNTLERGPWTILEDQCRGKLRPETHINKTSDPARLFALACWAMGDKGIEKM